MVHNNKLMNKKINKMMKMDNFSCKKMISDIFVLIFFRIQDESLKNKKSKKVKN